ncbi:hypothetical protein ACFX2K_004577 [Malus domestica]
MVISNESKVAEFIDPVSRVWNIDLLSHFVSKAERVAISHIHVGPLLRPDKIVWPFERNGSYTVKFGYSCKASPKMRNFIWRALCDACATKFNLFRRRCALSPICPICAEGDDTVEHILLICPWTTRVWNIDLLSLQVYPYSFRTLQAIATALDPFKMVSTLLRLSTFDRISHSRGMHQSHMWYPPPVNWIKLNVDAYWKRDSLCGHIGVIARDSLSGCKAVRNVRVFVSSTAMTEALAVLE